MGVFTEKERAWEEHQAMREDAWKEYLWPSGKAEPTPAEDEVLNTFQDDTTDSKTIPRVQALRELAKDYIPFRNPRYDAYRDDREVCLTAIKGNPNNYGGSHASLQNNREFNKEALAISHLVFPQLPQTMRADRELALMAIQKDGDSLKHTAGSLNNDPQIVLLAYKRSVSKEQLKRHIGKALRDEIGNNDPVNYIEKHLMKNKLELELPTKDQGKQQTKAPVKV